MVAIRILLCIPGSRILYHFLPNLCRNSEKVVKEFPDADLGTLDCDPKSDCHQNPAGWFLSNPPHRRKTALTSAHNLPRYTAKLPSTPHLQMVKNPRTQNPQKDSYRHKNLTTFSLRHVQRFYKISPRSSVNRPQNTICFFRKGNGLQLATSTAEYTMSDFSSE